MKDYTSAGIFLGIAVLIGWLGMIGGVVIFALSLSGKGGLLAGISFGLPFFAAGLMSAAVGEIGQAVIETAINSRKSNLLLGQMLKALEAKAAPAAYSAPPSVPGGPIVKTYRGVAIFRVDEGYSANGVVYENVLAAERAIDRA